MQAATEISKQDLKELLNKGWLTHDAMWFYCCFQELGIEKTNELNRGAVGLMAMIETKRMLKTLSMRDEVFDSFEKVWRFFEGARQIVIPDWMDFTFESPRPGVIRWEWRACFAHDGLKRIGAIDGYQCGVMYRIESWLNTLGVRYEMKPKVEGCLMRETGACKGEIHFFFDGS